MNGSDLEIIPSARLKLEDMDIAAAKRTRTVIMFLGPLLYQYEDFVATLAGGCNLGKRTVEPHLSGLRHFGMSVTAETGLLSCKNQCPFWQSDDSFNGAVIQ